MAQDVESISFDFSSPEKPEVSGGQPPKVSSNFGSDISFDFSEDLTASVAEVSPPSYSRTSDISFDFSSPDDDLISSLTQQSVGIPGLIIEGGQVAKLPESLPSIASEELIAGAGDLSLDQLNSRLRRASFKYSRTRDPEKRVKILGEFIQNWNPEKAKELGVGQDGYIEPTGLMKVLDFIDIVIGDRALRVAGESLYEYKETQAANALQGKDTSIKQLASLLSQNWKEDRGRLEEGGQAVKSWALWATTPFGIDNPQEAEEFYRRSASYDAAEQDFADSIVTNWHNLAGTLKGKSRAEIEQTIQESIAQGSQGGQMTIDLLGMVAVSPINFLGIGPFRGAMTGVTKAAAARQVSNLGLKYNPLGNLRLGRMEIEAMPRAREQMIEELTDGLRAAEGLPEVSDIAAQSAVRGLRRKSEELTGIEAELLSLRKQEEMVAAGKIDDAVAAERLEEIADAERRYEAASKSFNEEFASLSKLEDGPIPANLVFDDIQARAARMAAWEVADATEVAFRKGVKSGAVGSRAASVLAEAKAKTKAINADAALDVEAKWASALKEASDKKKVLVDLGLNEDALAAGKVVTKPVFMTPSEARVFENAKDGAYGAKAQVASYYPGRKDVMIRSVGGEAKFKALTRRAGDEILAISEGPSIRGIGRRAVKRGVQAVRGMDRAQRIFNADRLVSNVDTFAFTINHAIAKKVPWIEKYRIPVAGVLSMTRRPMHYARKGEDGKWVPIKRNEMVHPARFYKATLAERQRLTDMSVLRAEWPVWRAKMEAVGGDMAIINMGRKVYELGWASPEAALATADDLLKVVAIEKLQKVADDLAKMGTDVALGEGRSVTVLSPEEVNQARAAISTLDGLDVETSALRSVIDEYEVQTTQFADELAVLTEKEAKSRAAFLESLRSSTNYLYAATQASVSNRMKFQSELAIGRIADDFVPELDEISKQINSIDEQLSALKLTGKDAEEMASAAKSQLDEAFRVLGLDADEVGKAKLLREMDPYVNAYKSSLSSFKMRMGDELGEEAAEVAGDALAGVGDDLLYRAVEPDGKSAFPIGANMSRDELEDVFFSLSNNSSKRAYADGQKDLVNWISKNASDPEYRAVAERIAPYVSGKFLMRDPSEMARNAGGTFKLKVSRAEDLGDPGGTVSIKASGEPGREQLSGVSVEVALHELVHSATVFRISRGLDAAPDSALAKSVEALSDLAVDIRDSLGRAQAFDDLRHPGTYDVRELVAYGLTSTRFQETLKGIKVEGGKTAFSKFVDLLAEILGLKGKEVSALSELIRITDELLEAPVVAPSAKKLDAEIIPRFEDTLDVRAVRDGGATASVRTSKPLSDTAQAYIDSVRVAWTGGKEVPVLSLFDSMWDNARGIIDPSLLGRKSIASLGLPAKVKGRLDELARAAREVDAAKTRVASASPDKIDEAEAALDAAVAKNDRLRNRYATQEVKTSHRLKKAEDFVHAPGSDSRQVLEALRLHYTNRMASINAQVATEAHDIRVASTEAISELQQRLMKQGLIPEGKEKELSEALQRLSEAMFGKQVSVSLAGTKDLSADILLRRAVAKSRRVKDPAGRAAVLSDELQRIQARLAKVGDEKNMSDLQRALNRMDELRKKKKSLKEVRPQLSKAVEQEIDNLLSKMDELDFDLRHPDDARRQLIGKLDSAYNNLESGAGLYHARLRALRDADVGDLIKGMSNQQKARVAALLKNPKLRNKLDDAAIAKQLGLDDVSNLDASLVGRGGQSILLKETQAALAAARARLDKYVADGAEESIELQRGNVARLERELEILGSSEDVNKVMAVAELMKRFFDENLDRLKASGVLDEAFDADEFFTRVDVGAYFPHILSQGARKRLDAIGAGSGARVGRTITSYFSKKREIAGVVDDINEAGRLNRAQKIFYHSAKNGEYGEDVAAAAARGEASLKKYLKESGQDYDELLDEISQGALLNQFDELFETDTFAVMEYYHRKASQAVADARFINTTLDLFPTGRLIAELPVAQQAKEAERLGYVRLSEVEYLEATLQRQLPKGLRSLTPTLKAHVARGASLEEIKSLVAAELGAQIDPDILVALSSNKVQLPYVPMQIKEYLNWRNSADALIVKKTVGSDVWDGLQAWAKTQATIVALAHIGRNFIGNTISTIQELGLGAINPFTQMTAMRIWGTWGDKNLNQIIEIGGREMTVKGWREFFSSRGFFDNALSTDFLSDTMGISSKAVPTNQALAKQLAGTSVGAITGMALGSAIGAAAPGFFLGGALGLGAGKKWSGVKSVRGGASYKKFVKEATEEIKEAPAEGIARVANQATGAAVGGIIGSAAFGVGAIPGAIIGGRSINDFINMMGGLNRAAESQARLSTAIGLMKRGVDPEEALVRVNRSLRDYSDLTPLEKGVFRRFFFFYTWEAGNIKYQLQWMKERPRTVRALSAFTNGLYQTQFDEEHLASIPEHYRYPIVIRSGTAKLIALSGLPHQPMLELMTRSKEGYPMQGVMTRMHPAILTFMEMTVGGGRSFYYGRPISELNNINQLKDAPPLLKKALGYPESPNYYVPIYKNGVKTNRTRAVRKSTSPVLYYLAQKFPGYRWMNEYYKIATDSFNSYALEAALTPDEAADARATHFERAMMFMFGLRQTAIDWDYESYRVAKEMEDNLLDEIQTAFPRAVGVRRYLRRELSARPSPELEELE